MSEQTESNPTSQPARRVVVAEDETLIRLDIIEILRGEGYDVVGEADNGEKAVQLTEELKPDLVLMDVKMPIMDGIPDRYPLARDAVKYVGEAVAVVIAEKRAQADDAVPDGVDV